RIFCLERMCVFKLVKLSSPQSASLLPCTVFFTFGKFYFEAVSHRSGKVIFSQKTSIPFLHLPYVSFKLQPYRCRAFYALCADRYTKRPRSYGAAFHRKTKKP